MLLKDVKIGGRYVAKVSGKLTVVVIKEIAKVESGFSRSIRTRILAVNEKTGRAITIKSAAKIRLCVDKE